jgi:molecular chaperone Hsp33
MDSKLRQLKLRDRVVRAMTADGFFRVAAIKNSTAVRTAQEHHNLSPLNAVLLGRLMSAASLMSSFLQGEERVILEINGAGPLRHLYAEALQVGEVRGYSANPGFMPDVEGADAHFQLSDALGIGLLKVTRIVYNQYEPTTGVVELYKGDISTDIAYYLHLSEQIPSAVVLDVVFDDEGNIKNSGGIIAQAMPGAPLSAIQEMHDSLAKLTKISEMIDDGYTPEEMLKIAVPFELIETEKTAVDFFCRCSMDKFKTSLKNLGADEIRSMQADGHNELVCKYCGTTYRLTPDDFRQMLTELSAQHN